MVQSPFPEVNHGFRPRSREIAVPGGIRPPLAGGARRLPGPRMRRGARSPGPGRGAARGRGPGRPGPGRRGHRRVPTDPGRVPRGDRDVRARNPSRVAGFGPGPRPRDGRGHRRRRGARHARRGPLGRPDRRIRAGPGHRRAVHAARSPRRGRDGHRLPGRAIPAGQAAGGPEADQGRHGLADRPGPVRRRTPGAGDDGPPQHRPGLRRRGHRRQPAVLRDGAGPAASRSPTTATGTACRSTPGSSCSSRSARRCSTPTRRGSSTATSSPPT